MREAEHLQFEEASEVQDCRGKGRLCNAKGDRHSEHKGRKTAKPRRQMPFLPPDTEVDVLILLCLRHCI